MTTTTFSKTVIETSIITTRVVQPYTELISSEFTSLPFETVGYGSEYSGRALPNKDFSTYTSDRVSSYNPGVVTNGIPSNGTPPIDVPGFTTPSLTDIAGGQTHALAELNHCIANFGNDCRALNLTTTNTWEGAQGNNPTLADTPDYIVPDSETISAPNYTNPATGNERENVTRTTDTTIRGYSRRRPVVASVSPGDLDTLPENVAQEDWVQDSGTRTIEVTERGDEISYKEETQETEKTVTDYKSTDKKHWDFSVVPLVFLDIQTPKTVINMSKAASPEVEEILDGHNTSVPKLQLSHNESGSYLVTQRDLVRLGVGAAGAWNYVDSGSKLSHLNLMIGLAPMGGTHIVSQQIVKDKRAISNLKALTSPTTVSEIDSWSIGSKILSEEEGGVLMLAGLGYKVIYAGGNYIQLGKWSKEIQKIDENTVFVKLKSSKMYSAGKVVASFIIALSNNEMDQLENSFSYIFDLRSEQAREALQNLLDADLREAQTQSIQAHDVLAINSENTKIEGSVNSVGIGVPFVYSSQGTGKFNSKSNAVFLPDGSQASASIGMYVKNSDQRFFNLTENSSLGLYASSYDSTNPQGVKTPGYGAQVVYSYTDTDASRKDLQQAIEDAIKVTGLRNVLEVQLPDIKNSGFAEIRFTLNINERATNYLMNVSQQKNALPYLKKLSSNLLNAYFEHKNSNQLPQDLNNICSNYTSVDIHDAERDIIDYEYCRREYYRDTAKAVTDMIDILQKMANADPHKERDEFVKLYAQFGEKLLTNQFTFQMIFNSVKRFGISASYSIRGQELKDFSMIQLWHK